MPPIIRDATEHDCPAIAAITNAEIERGVAHFSTVPDDPREVTEAWRRDHGVYPWLVAVDADDEGRERTERVDMARPILGFARAAKWKPRGAYDWTCESAVYVHDSARGLGVGRLLYNALFAELRIRGFRCVIAGVTVPNPASERLHLAMGMTDAGTFRDVGFKQGRWLDVRYYTLTLGDGSPPAGPPRKTAGSPAR